MLFEALALSLLLIFAMLLGEMLSGHLGKYSPILLSFGAGLLVTTLFTEFLPKVANGQQVIGEYVFIVLAIGFVLTLALEKVVLQKAPDEDMVRLDEFRFKELGMDMVGFLAGMLIPVMLDEYGELAALVLIPFYVRKFAISVALPPTPEIKQRRPIRVVSALMPLLGTVVGLLIIGDQVWLYLVLAFGCGILFYISIRDFIPQGRSGRPLYFVFGMIVALMLSAVLFGIVKT
jgi:zinc transporter ZupT